jgi:hypothetical protein
VSPRVVARRSPARAWARVGVCLCLSGCVTTYEDAPLFGNDLERPDFAVAQTIPIAAATDPRAALIAEFYASVLQRMHAAASDGDLVQLEALVANYERSDLPDVLRERVAGYRLVANGMRFCREAAQRAELAEVVAAAGEGAAVPREIDAPALGAPLQLELRIPAPASPVVLGGEGDTDPIGFLVSVTIDDTFANGNSYSSTNRKLVALPRAIELSGDAVLRLPIEVAVAGANAVRRDLHVRVDLMPGYVAMAAGRAPIALTAIAAKVVTQWPVGYGAVAEAPLRELQAALRAFEPPVFQRAYLAATAARGADRDTAIDLLVEQVRYGRADQALVAMAALRAVTGATFLVGDRDAWLAWSQARAGGK